MPDSFDQQGEWQLAFIADCIARVTSCWAGLEYDISATIWALAEMRPALGTCVTSQIYTLQGRLSAVSALAKLRRVDQDIIDRLNRFSDRIREGQDQRNRIIHNLSVMPEKDKQLASSVESVFDLHDDLEKIERLAKEFGAIRKSIEAAVPTLPDTPPELHPIMETPSAP
jgi:hypothetical protein